ncbi:hypothetical protein [Pyruvatibacter mobilis]|uniref:hypothetical protein n=1 Tax=Pyruvatibacter mobilis TaxID=1712261 RepID=UPI003BABF9C0
MARLLSDLMRQLPDQCRRGPRMCLELTMTASGIDSHGPKQRTELIRGSCIETDKGTSGQASHFLEGGFCRFVKPFLEHEGSGAVQCQITGHGAHIVRSLFHAVTNIDHRWKRVCLGLFQSVPQCPPDLRMTATHLHACHGLGKATGVIYPAERLELSMAAEIGKLDVQPSKIRSHLKHLSLHTQGLVPGLLPAHRGIHDEEQSAPCPPL